MEEQAADSHFMIDRLKTAKSSAEPDCSTQNVVVD